MPIYEYQCQSCGHQFEKLQKISDPVLKQCPHCEKPELKKLISAAGFKLKGTGWYETDFKSSKSQKDDVKNSHTTSSNKEQSPSKKTSVQTQSSKPD